MFFLYFFLYRFPDIKRLECFLEENINRLPLLSIYLQNLFIPFEFQGANSNFSNMIFHNPLPLFPIIVGIFILIIFLVRSLSYKFTMSWILLTIIPGLWYPDPMVRERYLYIPLIGVSFLLALLIRDLFVNKMKYERRIVFKTKIVVVLLLLASFVISRHSRYVNWFNVGKITEGAVSIYKRHIKDPKKSVVYFLNNTDFVNRLRVFPGSQIEVIDVSLDIKRESSPYTITVELHSRSPRIKQVLYSILEMKRRSDFRFLFNEDGSNYYSVKENERLFKGDRMYSPNDEVLVGVNDRFPSFFDRYIVCYTNMQTVNITAKCYPKTQIIFKVKLPDARTVSLVGTFNDWDETQNPLTYVGDSTWTGYLWLSPGKYAYQFVIDGHKYTWNPTSEYYVHDSRRGKVSVLVVANHALPIGLLPSGNEDFDRKVIEYKKRLIMNPDDTDAHEELGNLYHLKGFHNIAELEYKAAE
jgi:hypothetical protein